MPSAKTLLLFGALATACIGTTTALAAPAVTKISIEKAERIALERVPGGTIEKIEREHHLGKLVWEVDVRAADGREHEITIDAADGKIVAEEIDD